MTEVECAPQKHSQQILSFCMGKNTPKVCVARDLRMSLVTSTAARAPIEDNIEPLRYDKVILATDADAKARCREIRFTREITVG